MVLESVMLYSGVRIAGQMVSVFREPVFRLATQASDIMETFYKALQPAHRLSLNNLLTFGGNSYADLKLTINTFGGGGRIDITPNALFVELRDLHRETLEAAKEHLQLCENTLRKALNSVELSERLMRASISLVCEGGPMAVEAFLGEKGNAALKLDEGAYATWKKEFLFHFNGLDASTATKVSLALHRSLDEGDLFLQFDHTQYGNPDLTQTVEEQFGTAEKELQALMLHLGLEAKKDDAGQT
jgi:hypothetical protein